MKITDKLFSPMFKIESKPGPGHKGPNDIIFDVIDDEGKAVHLTGISRAITIKIDRSEVVTAMVEILPCEIKINDAKVAFKDASTG